MHHLFFKGEMPNPKIISKSLQDLEIRCESDGT